MPAQAQRVQQEEARDGQSGVVQIDHFWTVEDFDEWRVWITVATIIWFAALTLATAFFVNVPVAIGLLVLNTGYFLWDSFVIADPNLVHKLIPKLFQKWVNVLLGPGWVYIPWHRLMRMLNIIGYGFMDGREFSHEFAVRERTLSDEGEVEFEIYFYDHINPNDPEQVIRIGGLGNSLKRIHQQVEQILREWICSPDSGPVTADDARSMREEAINRLLERLFEWNRYVLDSDMPYEAVIGFAKHRELTDVEKRLYAVFCEKPPDERSRILEAGTERLEFINKLRDGRASVSLSSLGLTVLRCGIGQIRLVGETAEHADEVNRVANEMRMLKMKTKGIRDAAQELVGTPGMIMDPVNATMIAQNLIKREEKVNQFQLPDNLVKLLEVFGQPLVSALASRLNPHKKED